MFIAVVQHTPVRVWGLLAVLVALGRSQARHREMSLMLVMIVLSLSLSGLFSAFGHFPAALGGWVGGAGAALAFARQFIAVRGAAGLPQTARLHVPGSRLPVA